MSTWSLGALVVLGAALGGMLRLVAVSGRRPVAMTVLCNTVGSFVVGLAAGLGLSAAWWALLATGVAGALTTFSSLSVQTVEAGWRRGTLLACATLVAATAAAGVGWALGQWLP